MAKTKLYPIYQKYSGKIIDFAGWELPVYFSDIVKEHLNVRENAGLFDVSHMGEILVYGDNASYFVQKIITNSVEGMEDNQVIYTPICNYNAGTVDDVLVYKFNSKKYLFVVNASNIKKDFEWLKNNNSEGVTIENLSDRFVQLALQGPKAEQILEKLASNNLSNIGFFRFSETKICGVDTIVSRTGYTGEDGFEIYIDVDSTNCNPCDIWEAIMEAGQKYNILPIGIGARDTLRLEASLPLYGHELADDISPLEAGLGFFVKLNKSDFIGKNILVKQKESGLTRKIVGFEMIDGAIPRNGYTASISGKKIGYVASGSYSPTLDKKIGNVLIDAQYIELGNEFDIEIRGKKHRARIIKTPFYNKRYKKS